MARRRLSVIDAQNKAENTTIAPPLADESPDYMPGQQVEDVMAQDGSEQTLALISENDGSGINLTGEELRRMVESEQERRSIIRTYIARNLKSGTDYGSISVGGRESKPSLFKPGAEKVCSLLQLRAEFEPDHATLAMAGNLTGLFAFTCRLIDRAGRVVGEGRGAADLSEKRGWTVNNAIKICEKRAQVDAVLRVVGLSEIFTQDIEDAEQRIAMEQDTRRTPASAPAPQPTNIATRPAIAPAPAPAPQLASVAPRPASAPVAEVAPAPVAPAPAPTPQPLVEEMCSEAQERQIRTLLPRAGMSEAQFLSDMRVTSIRQLSRNRAYRVIDRLAEKAKSRT